MWQGTRLNPAFPLGAFIRKYNAWTVHIVVCFPRNAACEKGAFSHTSIRALSIQQIEHWTKMTTDAFISNRFFVQSTAAMSHELTRICARTRVNSSWVSSRNFQPSTKRNSSERTQHKTHNINMSPIDQLEAAGSSAYIVRAQTAKALPVSYAYP